MGVVVGVAWVLFLASSPAKPTVMGVGVAVAVAVVRDGVKAQAAM